MKRAMLLLACSMLATSAQAGGDNSSELQCGVKLGGTSVVYTGKSQSENKQADNTAYRVGLIGSDASGVNNFSRSTSKRSDKRLPDTFTFAQFGCFF